MSIKIYGFFLCVCLWLNKGNFVLVGSIDLKADFEFCSCYWTMQQGQAGHLASYLSIYWPWSNGQQRQNPAGLAGVVSLGMSTHHCCCHIEMVHVDLGLVLQPVLGRQVFICKENEIWCAEQWAVSRKGLYFQQSNLSIQNVCWGSQNWNVSLSSKTLCNARHI